MICKECKEWKPYKGVLEPWGDCKRYCHPQNNDPLHTKADDECHKKYDGIGMEY